MNRLALVLMLVHGSVGLAGPLQLPGVLDSTERHLPTLKAALLERDLADADLLTAEGAFDVSVKVRAGATPGSWSAAGPLLAGPGWPSWRTCRSG